jgi:hypothetical protein
MFQNQLINAVVSWEWHLQMAEEIQKNLQGKPYEAEDEVAPPNGRMPFWKVRPDQPTYANCMWRSWALADV